MDVTNLCRLLLARDLDDNGYYMEVAMTQNVLIQWFTGKVQSKFKVVTK